MPLIFQHTITKNDLLANPRALYIYGDNVARTGRAGQAGVMRGAANALGVATKWAPGYYDEHYFTDERYNDQVDIVIRDMLPIFAALHERRIIIWPLRGIGTGYAELPERSPLTWAFLQHEVGKLRMIAEAQ